MEVWFHLGEALRGGEGRGGEGRRAAGTGAICEEQERIYFFEYEGESFCRGGGESR